MERLARVASLWNWLPAFRAVAETENLHEAARCLHVSPSALSRTIRLLEDQLEQPLFERTGRALRLTALGAELLGAVRAAMRGIDDAVAAPADVLRIAAPADVAAMWIVPLLTRRPGARARLVTDPQLDPVGRLLRGELDLVVTACELDDAHLLVEPVATVTVGLYVGGDHPLRRSVPTRDAALGWPFVAYRAPGGPSDRWPETLGRVIALHVGDARDAAAACASGELVAALPDELVRGLGLPLHRLPVDLVPPVAIVAARRKTLGPVHPADALVAALRARAEPLAS